MTLGAALSVSGEEQEEERQEEGERWELAWPQHCEGGVWAALSVSGLEQERGEAY